MKYVLLFFTAIFSYSLALAGYCESFLSVEYDLTDHRFIRAAKDILNSDNVRFFDGSNLVKPNPAKLLSSTWTFILDQNSIILGANIPGDNGQIGGSHSHLTLSKYAGIEANSQRMSGSVKFNINGTLFISGYHNKSFDQMSEIQALNIFRKISPSMTIRSTPERLFKIFVSDEEQEKYVQDLAESSNLFSGNFLIYDKSKIEKTLLLAIKFERLDILEKIIPLINWAIKSENRYAYWLVDLLKINGSEYLIDLFQKDLPLVFNQVVLNDLLNLYLYIRPGIELENLFNHFINIDFDIYYVELRFNVLSEAGDLRLAKNFLNSRHWKNWLLKYKFGFLTGLMSHPRRLILNQKNTNFFSGIFLTLTDSFVKDNKDRLLEKAIKTKNKNAVQALNSI